MPKWSDAPVVQPAAPAEAKPRWMEAQEVAPDGPSMPDPTMLDAAILNTSQGMTFGFGDEIAAGLRSGAGLWGDYGAELADERANLERARERHPWVSTAADLGGGIATGVGLAGSGATLMKAGQSLPKAMGLGALEGAAYGGAYGFGSGEGGAEERTKSAGKGAIIGGVIGGAVPAVARGVGKVVTAVKDMRAADRGERLILDDLAAEGVTPKEIERRASALGPEGMLADTSESLRLRAEQIAQSDNPARARVINSLNARGEGSKGRLVSAFDEAAGPAPNVKKLLDDATRTTKAMADELYGRARKTARPVNTTPLIESIDRTLYTDAEAAMQARSSPTADTLDREMQWLMGRLTGGGKRDAAGVTQVVDFDKLHTLQRDLRLKAQSYAKRGDDFVASGLRAARGKLLEALDASTETVPGDVESSIYRAARQQFADDKAVEEAFDIGRQIFSSKTHPDFLAAQIADMPAAERDALQIGVRSAVDEAMGRVKNGALKGRDLLNADWNERKVLEALGPERGRQLVDALLSEQAMAATRNQAVGNSATARRADNPFKASRETPDWSIGRMVGKGWRMATQSVRDGRAESLAENVAPLLTARGESRDTIARALTEKALERSKISRSKQETEALVRAILMGGGQSGGSLVVRR